MGYTVRELYLNKVVKKKAIVDNTELGCTDK